MAFPLVALAVLALVVIKALMGVVAHEEMAPPASVSYAEEPALATWSDDARAFLLPAEPTPVADAVVDAGTEATIA
jgi:hypothetical protein